MKFRIVTVALLACLWTLPLFALHYGQDASLWDHMMDVNVQWEAQVDDRTPFLEVVHFETDLERIQTHLFFVESILQSRSTAHLNSQQKANRLKHLAVLREYYRAGKFPQNQKHKDRTPYFFDASGTACAVGYLLVKDGQEAFARQIESEMNNAYVFDMPYSKLPAWATANGFELGELAWIQPAYEFQNTSWAPTGGGPALFNQAVHFFYEDIANGRVIIGGIFTMVGNIAANHIIAWDGQNFSPLGNGVSGTINCAINFNGKLYFGGQFNNGAANLAVWDGSNWSYSKVYNGNIMDMISYNQQLVIAGNLSNNGGALVQNILIGDVGNWTSIGQGFDAGVNALEMLNGELYAGGDFQNSGTTAMNYVGKWNGTAWQPVHNGLNSAARSLLAVNGKLYAGGRIYIQPGVFDYGIAEMGANTWETILDTNYILGFLLDGGFNSLKMKNGHIYAQGNFIVGSISSYSTDITVIDPVQKTLSQIAYTDQHIRDFGFRDQELLIGGAFTYVSPSNIPWIASSSVLAGVSNPKPASTLQAYPLPANDFAKVDLHNMGTLNHKSVEAYNISGKKVNIEWKVSANEMLIQRNTLPAGQYFMRMKDNDGLLRTVTILFQ